jgi:hypothetical protein
MILPCTSMISSFTSTLLHSYVLPIIIDNPFLHWMLKTRMSFYGDTDLNLPFFFFGICCWNYVIAGLTMLYTEPEWMPQWFPFRKFAFFLIFIQSPLSFIADYICMTHDSYWHVMDRFIAVPGMVLEVTKFAIMTTMAIKSPKHQHPITCFVYGLALCMALYCFMKSQQAQTILDHDGFCFWHTAWHIYPLIGSFIILIEHYNKINHSIRNDIRCATSTSNLIIGPCNDDSPDVDIRRIYVSQCQNNEGAVHHDTKHRWMQNYVKLILNWIHRWSPLYVSCCVVIILAVVTNTAFITS